MNQGETNHPTHLKQGNPSPTQRPKEDQAQLHQQANTGLDLQPKTTTSLSEQKTLWKH